MRMPIPAKTMQQPLDEVLKQATGAVPAPKVPDNQTPIPPMQRMAVPPESAPSQRSVIPYAIGGLVIGLLILGAIVVLPQLSVPAAPTATATAPATTAARSAYWPARRGLDACRTAD